MRAGRRSHALFRRRRRRDAAAAALLKPRLAAEGKLTVYETLERPLVPVLADMERAGITIDPDLLRKLSNDFANAHGGA